MRQVRQAAALAVATVVVVLLQAPAESCFMEGCSPARDYAQTLAVPASAPSAASLTILNVTDLGCSAFPVAGASDPLAPLAVCTSLRMGGPLGLALETGGGPAAVLVATYGWAAVANHSTLVGGTGALPLCSLEAAAVVSDGFNLAEVDAAGHSMGVIPVLPPLAGGVFSPAPSTNGLLVLASRRGSLASYLTNGVPHASIWLNTTGGGGGGGGTYVARAAPVVVEDRVFVLAGLQRMVGRVEAEVDAAAAAAGDTPHRLFAVDLHRTLDNRMTVAWNASLTLALANLTQLPTPPMLYFAGQLCLLLRRAASAAGSTLTCYRHAATSTAAPTLAFEVSIDGEAAAMAVAAAATQTDELLAVRVHGASAAALWLVTTNGTVRERVPVPPGVTLQPTAPLTTAACGAAGQACVLAATERGLAAFALGSAADSSRLLWHAELPAANQTLWRDSVRQQMLVLGSGSGAAAGAVLVPVDGAGAALFAFA